MSVEQLIERLQKMPAHYEVKAFAPGVEIEDFYNQIVDVGIDIVTKDVLLEFDPTPTNKFTH
jgi:hypothetical protein